MLVWVAKLWVASTMLEHDCLALTWAEQILNSTSGLQTS